MKHVARILKVAVAVLVAEYATAIQTPVVVTWLDRHPADAAAVSLGAGLLVAAYEAAKQAWTTTAAAQGAPVSGSSMGAK